MVWVIVLVICALFAALNGDSSGIITIAKIIGIGALILGIMWIFAYCPWILIIVAIGVVLFFVCQTPDSKSSTNNNLKDDLLSIENNQTIFNPNLTGFKAELQENTKTPSKVEDEEWEKEKEQIILRAESDYSYLKKELLNMAQSAQYTVSNDTRNITATIELSFLCTCISREYSSNPTGKQFTSSYRPNKKVVYKICKQRSYNFYLNEIKKLASKDDMNIYPMFSVGEKYTSHSNYVNLPYTDTGLLCTSHEIKSYLCCTIQY